MHVVHANKRVVKMEWMIEAVVQTCSVKKVLLEILKNSQGTPVAWNFI